MDILEESLKTENNAGIIGDQRKNWDHSDNNTTDITKNTYKSPGELRSLAVNLTGGKPPIITGVEEHCYYYYDDDELEILIQIVRIYSQDIGMKFGIEKCARLIMNCGKKETTEGIEMPNQERIRTLREKENYRYLGILEVTQSNKWNVLKPSSTVEVPLKWWTLGQSSL